MLLSLAVTIAWWAGVNCSLLFADAHIGHGQLHRLLTSALLHRDPLHLAFNFYWLWTFGVLIERHVGSAKTFALYVALAIGSGAAEHALLTGGVGLSGIVYGLFGLLWLFWKRRPDDHRFHNAVDRKTEICFAAWFIICVVMTLTDLLPVGNIAHLAGAMIGMSVGWAMMRFDAPRRSLAVPAAAVLLLIFAAVFARAHINLSAHAGEREASLGYLALSENRDAQAARWMREATAMNPEIASWWFNYAVAQARLQDHDAALAAYNNAARLDPSNKTYRAARDDLQTYLATLPTN
jgi:membrane associated rhomboid family serine protease